MAEKIAMNAEASPIQRERMLTSDVLEELKKAVYQLEGRLEPVLYPAVSVTEAKPSIIPQGAGSAERQWMVSMQEQLSNLRDKIYDLFSRCEL